MYPKRTYVRREGPGRLAVMSILLITGLVIFILFARPAMNAANAPVEERVTNDVTLASESVYLVEIIRSSDEVQARVEAARYVPRGAAGYLLKDGDEYLIIGSGYEEREEAEDVSLKLSAGESLDAVVHLWSQGEARLRITSTESQLSAFINADEIIRSVSRLFRQCSLSLDKGEKQPVEIRAELAAQLTATEQALAELMRAAGENPNAVVGEWIDILSLSRDYLSNIYKAEYQTSLYFSSALKYAFIDIRLTHIRALAALA
ncbi:MAG: hypothetical protein Q4D04_11615 [Clostridia bacterium]|nr:hypothetical protein [Clostridia bacterium]